MAICLALAAAISAAAVISANILAHRHGLPATRVGESLGLGGLILIFSFPVWILGRIVHHFRNDRENPISLIGKDILENRYHFFLSFFIYIIFIYSFSSFTTLKTLIPYINPFHSDIYIRDFEFYILGNDAVFYTHRIIGMHISIVFESFYLLWHVLNLYAAMWVVFTKDYEIKLRALISMLLSWLLLGFVLAAAFSSVGPILFDHFYGGNRFAPLLDQLTLLSQHGTGATMEARQFLLDNYGTQKWGSGISAMPSLHVGMAFLWFLMVRDRYRTIKRLSLVNFVMIFVASVHLGWHWVSDGLVSVAFVFGFWKFSGWLVRTADGAGGARLAAAKAS